MVSVLKERHKLSNRLHQEVDQKRTCLCHFRLKALGLRKCGRSQDSGRSCLIPEKLGRVWGSGIIHVSSHWQNAICTPLQWNIVVSKDLTKTGVLRQPVVSKILNTCFLVCKLGGVTSILRCNQEKTPNLCNADHGCTLNDSLDIAKLLGLVN